MARPADVAARIGLAPLLLCLACAGTGAAPAPGKASVYGTLRLVPHEGAPHSSGGGGSYGSRRMRDVGLVDYSTPGFAVVFLAEGAPPAGEIALAIRDTRVEPRIEPAAAAVGAGGRIRIENASASARIVSYPAAKLVRRMAPGEKLELAAPREGEQGVFLLDVPDAGATLFVAPGPYDVVGTTGDYELRDVEPGAHALRAWHPRFPPVRREVELAPDTRRRMDLEMGVGIEPGGAASVGVE
jgi:hypothetical protein